MVNLKNKISILISSGPPAAPEKKKASLLEKVNEMVRNIESNIIDSEQDIEYLACLYKKLCGCKRLKPEYREIKQVIKQVIQKHGKYNNLISVLDTGADNEYNLDNGYSSDDY